MRPIKRMALIFVAIPILLTIVCALLIVKGSYGFQKLEEWFGKLDEWAER